MTKKPRFCGFLCLSFWYESSSFVVFNYWFHQFWTCNVHICLDPVKVKPQHEKTNWLNNEISIKFNCIQNQKLKIKPAIHFTLFFVVGFCAWFWILIINNWHSASVNKKREQLGLTMHDETKCWNSYPFQKRSFGIQCDYANGSYVYAFIFGMTTVTLKRR